MIWAVVLVSSRVWAAYSSSAAGISSQARARHSSSFWRASSIRSVFRDCRRLYSAVKASPYCTSRGTLFRALSTLSAQLFMAETCSLHCSRMVFKSWHMVSISEVWNTRFITFSLSFLLCALRGRPACFTFLLFSSQQAPLFLLIFFPLTDRVAAWFKNAHGQVQKIAPIHIDAIIPIFYMICNMNL